MFVSIVSTKIPFKGAGKEYIGDDVEEMVAAVKSAIQACGVQLKTKIARVNAAKEQKLRKKNLLVTLSGGRSHPLTFPAASVSLVNACFFAPPPRNTSPTAATPSGRFSRRCPRLRLTAPNGSG